MAVDQSLPRGFTLFLMMLLALNCASTACNLFTIEHPEYACIAMVVGFLFIGPFSDQYGRRKILILLALLNLAASICIKVLPDKLLYFQIAGAFAVSGYASLAYAIAAKTDEAPTGSLSTFLLTACLSGGAIILASVRNWMISPSGQIAQIVLSSLLFLNAVIFLDSKDREQVPFPSTLRLYGRVQQVQTFRSFGFVTFFGAMPVFLHFLALSELLPKLTLTTHARALVCIPILLGVLLGSISRGERAAAGASVLLTTTSFFSLVCGIILVAAASKLSPSHVTIIDWVWAISSAFALLAAGLLLVTSHARALIAAKEFPGTAANTLFLALGLGIAAAVFANNLVNTYFGNIQLTPVIITFVGALLTSMIARRA